MATAQQRLTVEEQNRWVGEPTEEQQSEHALVCFNCHLLVFGRRCLWHHSKKCVQFTSNGRILLCTKKLWSRNCGYDSLFWIDCRVCDLQWPGRCNQCIPTPWIGCTHLQPMRRAKTSWVRLTYRIMCLAILKSKLNMVCKRDLLLIEFHPFVASFW